MHHIPIYNTRAQPENVHNICKELCVVYSVSLCAVGKCVSLAVFISQDGLHRQTVILTEPSDGPPDYRLFS